MVTVNDLITKATNLNCTIRYSENNLFIGIRFNNKKSEYIWHWFKIYTYIDGTNEVTFDHSYSQNTGYSKKSIRQAVHVKNKLKLYND